MPSSPSSEVHPEPEVTALAPDDVRPVRDLITVLVRTVKTLRLYDARNPVYKKALRDMGERFRGHVGRHGGFTLTVEQERLQLGDEVLHVDDDPKEGIAFRLYTDGVRAITFGDGLSAEEVKIALELLARGTALSSGDDDIVTLFWGADLPNIEVEAVEDDPPDFQLTSTHHDGAEPRLDEAVREAGAAPPPEGPQRVHFGQQALSVFVLGTKEQAYVKQLIDREAGQDPVQDLVGILGDVLSIDGNETEFAETVDICAGLLVEFLSEGRFADADALVRAMTSAVEGREQALGAGARGAVAEIVDGLGEGGFLASLGDGLAKGFGEPGGEDVGDEAGDGAHARAVQQLSGYLGRIARTDPAEMLRMAASQPDPAVRDALCDTVARGCHEDRQALLDLVSEADPVLLQCVLRVLGRVGTPAELPRLGQLSRNVDANVRRAALEAVCRIAGGAHAQLYPYLTDADSRIRRRALAMIESSGFRQGLETLMGLTARPVFSGWEINERRAVFNCIGVLGGDDVLGFFESHLGRRRFSLFGARKDEDLALCAVAGLKAVGSDAARAALEGAGRRGSRKVRAACEWALRELGGAG